MARNSTLTVKQVGERLDLEVRQGSTLGPIRHTRTDGDDVPLDLTGCTVRGMIRKTVASAEIVGEFVISMPAPTEGWYEFGLPAAITEAFTAGATATMPESRYVWDSEQVNDDGTITPLFFGEFRVVAEVTRPQDA